MICKTCCGFLKGFPQYQKSLIPCRKANKTKRGMKMTSYWIYKNGKKYAFTQDKEQAKNIYNALVKAENEKQNSRNEFINLSVEIKAIEH